MQTFDTVEREALDLPETDRALLVKRLLISLEPPADESVEKAWGDVIASRVQEVREGRAVGRSVEELLQEARAKYS